LKQHEYVGIQALERREVHHGVRRDVGKDMWTDLLLRQKENKAVTFLLGPTKGFHVRVTGRRFSGEHLTPEDVRILGYSQTAYLKDLVVKVPPGWFSSLNNSTVIIRFKSTSLSMKI
jgi:hypothetical protein